MIDNICVGVKNPHRNGLQHLTVMLRDIAKPCVVSGNTHGTGLRGPQCYRINFIESVLVHQHAGLRGR